MKNFTSVKDIDSVDQWVEEALKIKANPLANADIGRHKCLGLLFFNPSLRTRMSTQRAAYNLGLDVMVINLNNDGWQIEMEEGSVMSGGSQEHIKEAAAVVSQYCEFVGVRTFPSLTDRDEDYSDKTLNQFMRHLRVPLISLESAILHPLQSFADVMTIKENQIKELPKVVLSWAPHPKALPQAVANSFVEWIKHTDVELVITNPPGFDLNPVFTKGVPVVHKQEDAFANADFIYAKNWSSYEDYGKIGAGLDHWLIDEAKMKLSNHAKFMHCLPVRRNVVVSDAVIDSSDSLVIEQANNRTYAAQTVLLNMLKNEK